MHPQARRRPARPSIAAGCALALLALWSGAAHGAPVHLVLDFIDSSLPYDPAYLTGFEPAPLTGPAGLLAQRQIPSVLTESQIRRRIAAAVEDAFRDLAPGAGTAPQIRFHLQPPSLPEGERTVRLLLASASNAAWPLLGQAQQASYNRPDLVPDGHYAAAVYLDEIVDLPLDLTHEDSLINALAGTAIHELGHVFGAVHPQGLATQEEPFPVMAIESTPGFETWMRATQRRFTDPANTLTLQAAAGSSAAADLQMDGAVNGIDAGVLIAGWGQEFALHGEGDINGDHRVDGVDATALIASWTTPQAVPEPSLVGLLSLLGLSLRCTRRRGRSGFLPKP